MICMVYIFIVATMKSLSIDSSYRLQLIANDRVSIFDRVLIF